MSLNPKLGANYHRTLEGFVTFHQWVPAIDNPCPTYVLHISVEVLDGSSADDAITQDGPYLRCKGLGYLELTEMCMRHPQTWHAETRTPPDARLREDANG